MRKPNDPIVVGVESRLAAHIIDTTKCLEGCKCQVCFQKYLDSVVNSSDALTPQEAPVFQVEEFVG